MCKIINERYKLYGNVLSIFGARFLNQANMSDQVRWAHLKVQAELLHYHFEYLHLNLHRYSSTVQVQFLKRLHFLKNCKFFPMKAEWPVQVQVQLV